MTEPATPAQLAYIRDLLDVKAVPDVERAKIEARLAADDLLKSQASGTIDYLKTCRRRQPPAVEALEVGVYVMPSGVIVKVQPTRDKTRVYAMEWVEIGGERVVDDTGEHVRGEWRYAPSMLRFVQPQMKMDLDQARAFILRYGQCARCGRRLKAARSVERGIGPRCIRYFSIIPAAPATLSVAGAA
jgi:hypothetical protein